MTSQIEYQKQGENLIRNIYKAFQIRLNTLNDNIDSNKVRLNPYESSNELSIEVVNSIIYYEASNIFKMTKNIIKYFEMFINVIDNKSLTLEKRTKFYNTDLNYILLHINHDFIEDEDIKLKRQIILRMKFYKKYLHNFKDIKILLPPEQVTNHEETRFNNYDNTPVITSQKIKIRIPKTINKITKTPGQGVVFACYDLEEFFNMLCVSVQNATREQLKIKNDNNNHTGCLKYNGNIFYIELCIQHGLDIDAIIESYSSKIIYTLSNGNTQSKILHSRFLNPYTGEYQINPKNSQEIYTKYDKFHFYIKYHNLVIKKIYELINASFSIPDFDYVVIQCYRPECNHRNIFDRTKSPIKTCRNCVLGSFCLLCGKSSHKGPCDADVDTQSKLWIDENTKECPSCHTHIQRNDGCNHMTCTICHTHFCWLCNQTYTVDQINKHYINMDAYGRCQGRTN
jgi:hypothetical protein